MLAIEFAGLERLMCCHWGGGVVQLFVGGFASTAMPYRICLVSYQTSADVWLGYRLLASKAHGKMARQGLDL